MSLTICREPVDHGHFSVGRHSFYFGEPFAIYGPDDRIEVGAFCSIADETRILGGGEHALDLPSTYPLRTLLFRPDEGEWDIFAKDTTRLGNDVWVGRRATILAGAQIGDGAVIAAGSMVTSTVVPPYAIVAGNPARVIGFRFDEATITRLLAVRWWDWPDERLREMEPYFYSAIDVFLDEAERRTAPV